MEADRAQSTSPADGSVTPPPVGKAVAISPEKQKDKHPPAKVFGVLSSHAAVEVAAGVSSMLMGAVTAWRLVMERSHNNISTLGIIKDLKGPRDSWGDEHIGNLKAGMSREKSAELIKNASAKYQSLLSERFEKAGFKTFSERLNILHPFQKWEVAITSLAVTGVALGSLLLLTKDMFKEAVDKKEDEKSPAPRPASFVEAEQNKIAVQGQMAPTVAL